MKKIVLTALTASLLISGATSVWAEENYQSSSTYTEKSEYETSKSSQMRLEYYNKYKAKGYDVSSLDAYLDGAKTTESQFWEALKQVQNNHEVPDRRAYVEKLRGYGYDVSGFTEEIIWDSGKFWEMYKAVEAGKKVEEKKEEYKKVEEKKETIKKVEEKKEVVKNKVEEKKSEVKEKVEEKRIRTVVKISAAQSARLTKLLKDRIDKLSTDTRDATLVRLESTLTKAIEAAEAKNAQLLVARYKVLLTVVQEEMDNVDDESLINSLFIQ